MDHASAVPAYGLWGLAILNSAVFIMFAFSFFKPRTTRDWRSLSAFSAFIVALFVEMYGFPLTIYLTSGWLARQYPGVDFLTHNNGHLLHTLFRMPGDPHFDPFHILSYVFVLGGFMMLSYAWRTLWEAQRAGRLATTGLYARLRHPQYVAFVLIMFGFLMQWPTLLTLAMFPVLTVMYARLALHEEAEAHRDFGAAYERWAAATPRFLPRWSRSAASAPS